MKHKVYLVHRHKSRKGEYDMVKFYVTQLVLVVSITGIVHAACNCQTRESDIIAGIHNKSEESCVALKATLFGVSIDVSARECTLGYVQYDDTVYKCGVPSEGNHCKSDGFKADYTTYKNGGCLGIPTNKEEALAFVAQGGCKELETTSSYDWSASTSSC